MSTLITVGRLSRNRLRLGTTLIASVDDGGTVVDAEDPAIKRDLIRKFGEYQLLANAEGTGNTVIDNVINNTGSSIAAGSLVSFSGWDETSGRQEIVKADANGTNAQIADGVLRSAIGDGETGQTFVTYRLTGQDTSATSVGDTVYLSETAGGWTKTAPTAKKSVVQAVGHVAVVHASAGVVELDVERVPLKAALPELKGVLKVDTVALAAVDTGGGVFSWQNPEGADIFVYRVDLDVTTAATGACTVDVGTTTSSATTSSDTLLDGLDVHTGTGFFSSTDDTDNGTNGVAKGQRLAAGKWVTGSKASGASAGIVGTAIIQYVVIGS